VSTIANFVSTSPVPVKIVVLPTNRGLAEALTSGLAECSFHVVARMDADDISEPERFEVQLALIDEGYELVGSGMREFIEDELGEHIVTTRTPPLDPIEIARYARFHDPFNHPTVVYTKAAVTEAGGYVPIGLMEDYWLFARMIARGTRVINVSAPLVRYRVNAGAYKRRGGLRLLASELALQRALKTSGFTNWGQFTRNVLVRGGYRLVPEVIRRAAYRRLILAHRQA
jgi:glycosyltransferase involved in cell wall biosynthesis